MVRRYLTGSFRPNGVASTGLLMEGLNPTRCDSFARMRLFKAFVADRRNQIAAPVLVAEMRH